MDFGLPVNEFEAYFGDTYEWMSEWINRLSVCVLFYRPKICNHPESRPCIISILNNIENLTSYGIWNPDFMLYNMTGLYNKWIQNAQRNSIWHFGVWYYIFFSKNGILEYFIKYFFENKNWKKCRLRLFKIDGKNLPGGETY